MCFLLLTDSTYDYKHVDSEINIYLDSLFHAFGRVFQFSVIMTMVSPFQTFHHDAKTHANA